jgi:hypothetical protein
LSRDWAPPAQIRSNDWIEAGSAIAPNSLID